MKLIKILMAASVCFVPAVCFSAPGDVTKTLRVGKSVSIKPSSCTLQISSERTNKIVVRCKRPSSSSSKKANITLRQGTKATIKSKSCFLAVKKRQPKSVVVKCQATVPTATPTATGSVSPTSIPVVPTATSAPTSTPTNTATPTLTPNAQAVTDNNRLLTFNTSSSELLDSEVNLVGVTTGETIVSIDRRPNNGMLYGLGYNPTTGVVQLYHISPSSGVVTAIGTPGSFVDSNGDPVRVGVDALTKIGMDFNPTADRIRVVTSNGQNFRMNPNSGAFVDGNLGAGPFSGTNMDGALNSASTFAGESAYTNNDTGNSVTTLYCVDPSADALMIQSPPNAGTLTTQGVFNQNTSNVDILEIRGFDIAAGVNVASSNAAVSSGSGMGIFEFASNSQQRLATINLTNAELSQGTLIGDGTDSFLGFALQSASAETVYALSSSGNLLKFKSNNPAVSSTITVSGLTSGETIVGIDFRPATGQLYALGVNETTDTATLYTIDPQVGALTVVGSASSISFVDSVANTVQLTSPSIGYGLDFNPTVDRIRVTTGSGLNFRMNPSTGAAVDGDSIVTGVNTDSNINSEVSSLHATSYTNSFNGTTVTTQYGLDATTNKLVIVNPPNAGSTSLVNQIREAGNVLDFSEDAAFEIRSDARGTASGSAVSSGTALAALTVSGVTSLYEIDLTDGNATNLGLIDTGSGAVVSMAISEKFAN